MRQLAFSDQVELFFSFQKIATELWRLKIWEFTAQIAQVWLHYKYHGGFKYCKIQLVIDAISVYIAIVHMKWQG